MGKNEAVSAIWRLPEQKGRYGLSYMYPTVVIALVFLVLAFYHVKIIPSLDAAFMQ